jgi:hypothetical protein
LIDILEHERITKAVNSATSADARRRGGFAREARTSFFCGGVPASMASTEYSVSSAEAPSMVNLGRVCTHRE